MSLDPFGDLLKQPYNGSGVDSQNVFGDMASGGPLNDRTASDAWRSQPATTMPVSQATGDSVAPPPDPGFFGNIGNAVGNWLKPQPPPPDQTNTSGGLFGMGNLRIGGSLGAGLASGLRDFASSSVQPIVNIARDPLAYLRGDPQTPYVYKPSGMAPYQEGPQAQNAMGLFGLVGAGALPYGAPEAALSRGSLGADAARPIDMGSLGHVAPDVVPGSIGDLGRVAHPEGAPVQNPTAGTLRTRLDLAPPEPPVPTALWNDQFLNPTPENPYPASGEPVRAAPDAIQIPANTRTTGLAPIEAWARTGPAHGHRHPHPRSPVQLRGPLPSCRRS